MPLRDVSTGVGFLAQGDEGRPAWWQIGESVQEWSR
jgi:hypothetical protein